MSKLNKVKILEKDVKNELKKRRTGNIPRYPSVASGPIQKPIRPKTLVRVYTTLAEVFSSFQVS